MMKFNYIKGCEYTRSFFKISSDHWIFEHHLLKLSYLKKIKDKMDKKFSHLVQLIFKQNLAAISFIIKILCQIKTKIKKSIKFMLSPHFWCTQNRLEQIFSFISSKFLPIWLNKSNDLFHYLF